VLLELLEELFEDVLLELLEELLDEVLLELLEPERLCEE
jgi:hypothetical protein